MQPGDVVKVRQFGDMPWVLDHVTHDMPAGTRWRCLSGHTDHIAGEGDLEHLATPAFTPGMVVRFNGQDAEVVSDDGLTVRVSFHSPRDLEGGGRIDFGTRFTNAAKPHLVLENLERFL